MGGEGEGDMCLGNVVVDREIISGLPDAGVADCLGKMETEGRCKGGGGEGRGRGGGAGERRQIDGGRRD